MRVLVSPTKKLCMFWSPKAGCSTALAIFFAYCDFDYSKYHWIHNARERVYQKKVHPSRIPEDFHTYVRLQVVRDPYTRAVSSFLHYMASCAKRDMPDLRDAPGRFLEFLLLLRDGRLNSPSGEFHAAAQYMTDEIDAVLKLETLEADIQAVNDRFGLDLKYTRYSPHSFEHKLGPRYEAIKDAVYSTEARALVERLYHKDFAFFDYAGPASCRAARADAAVPLPGDARPAVEQAC